jgi:GrpB-like predicted nucleotidyltransferase (UPF0157 family)
VNQSVTEEESLQAAIHEDVALHPYDTSWPQAFEVERMRLLTLFPGQFVEIEHIGSTAVPGLGAKPVIDLLGGVRSINDAEQLASPLCQSGYATSAAFNESLSDRKWFMRWANGHRTHHLHLVVHGGPIWHERLAFRNALQSRPELAARYVALKTQLATAHPNDREAYTMAKTEFVRAAVHEA